MNNSSIRNIITLTCLLVVVIYVPFVQLTSEPMFFDETNRIVGGVRILDGEMPLRDYWAHYSPLYYLETAFIFKLLGNSLLSIRTYHLLLYLLLTLFIFVLIKRYSPPETTRRRLIYLVVGLLSISNFIFVYFFVNFFYGALPILLLIYYQRNLNRLRLLAIGMFCGIAILHKTNFGMYTTATVFLSIILLHLNDSGGSVRWKRIASMTTWTALGFFSTVILLSYAYISSFDIAPKDALEQLYFFPARVLEDIRSLPYPFGINHRYEGSIIYVEHGFYLPELFRNLFPVWLSIFSTVLFFSRMPHRKTLLVSALLIINVTLVTFVMAFAGFSMILTKLIPVVLMLILAGFVVHYREALDTRRKTLVVLVLSCATYLHYFVSRSDIFHFNIMAVMIVAFMAIIIEQYMSVMRKHARVAIHVLAVCWLVLFYREVNESLLRKPFMYPIYLKASASAARHILSVDKSDPELMRSYSSSPRWFKLTYGFRYNEAAEVVLKIVDKVIPDDEYVFVGNKRHDLVNAAPTLMYFLLDRKIPTRYYMIQPSTTSSEKIQREIIAELEEKKVMFAVLEEESPLHIELFNKSSEAGSTVLDEWLKDNYVGYVEAGAFLILVHKDKIADVPEAKDLNLEDEDEDGGQEPTVTEE